MNTHAIHLAGHLSGSSPIGAQPAPIGFSDPTRGRSLAEMVTVVTVLYRSEAVIDAALTSVPAGVTRIAVDNASPDRSAERAAAAGARVIANDCNLGFGAGCNRGVEAVETPYTLFLNPDARLSPGSLNRLIEQLEADPQAAAAAPLLSSRGRVQMPRRSSLISVDRPHSFTEMPVETTDVGFLSGAALLVRTETFRALGGFDERIFLYLEDDDLCTRLSGAGYRLLLVPGAVAAHDSTPLRETALRDLREKNRNTLLSMRYLAKKHQVVFDFREMRNKAMRRVLLAMLMMDCRRLLTNIGRLQGMGVLPALGPK